MRKIILLLFLLHNLNGWANTSLQVQISAIETMVNEDTLIFLSNGQVAKIPYLKNSLLRQVTNAHDQNSWPIVQLDKNRYITGLSPTSIPKAAKSSHSSELKELTHFTPTVINSQIEAQQLFTQAKTTQKESQCFDRAHVWSYEWRIKHHIYSSKMWLFFTRKYIRKNNFEWWFHVSPYFHVRDGDKINISIADVKYAKNLLTLKQWTDFFLKNNADCPMISSYSEYSYYPESSWCYVMKSSMYYYQPLDLELFENYGIERDIWNPDEVRHAYKEAFDIEV